MKILVTIKREDEIKTFKSDINVIVPQSAFLFLLMRLAPYKNKGWIIELIECDDETFVKMLRDYSTFPQSKIQFNPVP